MTPINEHIIKISGTASLENELELGQDYKVTITGTIVSQTETDNDNGTRNKIHKLKPLMVESVEYKEKQIRIKDKSSTSQKNRSRHFIWQQDHPIDVDYDQAGELFRRYYDEIMDLALSLQLKNLNG